MISLKKKLFSKFVDNRNGEITIESMLVIIPIIFVMLFLLSLGFLLYQQWNIQIAADDAASKIAGSYSMLGADNKTGAIVLEDYLDVDLYRNIDLGIIGSATKYENKNKERITDYVTGRLSGTSFSNAVGTPDIKCEIVKDGYARKHLEITYTATYKIPFGEGMEVLGMDGERTFTATGSAECTDMMDYINAVQVAEVAPSYFSCKTLDAVESWMNVIVSIINFGKE